jgi:hypothetical protein
LKFIINKTNILKMVKKHINLDNEISFDFLNCVDDYYYKSFNKRVVGRYLNIRYFGISLEIKYHED